MRTPDSIREFLVGTLMPIETFEIRQVLDFGAEADALWGAEEDFEVLIRRDVGTVWMRLTLVRSRFTTLCHENET